MQKYWYKILKSIQRESLTEITSDKLEKYTKTSFHIIYFRYSCFHEHENYKLDLVAVYNVALQIVVYIMIDPTNLYECNKHCG